MTYIILAEICKALNIANWAISLCYIMFGVQIFLFILSVILKLDD